jgi:hypothetical protein
MTREHILLLKHHLRRDQTMSDKILVVLLYMSLSGLICAGLFANLNESDVAQKTYFGHKTGIVRAVLYFLFGGAILPFAFLLGAGVHGAAVLAHLIERNQHNQKQGPSAS